jgi:hypothetical protein
VYEHLTWLEGEAARAGIPVSRVTAGNLRQQALDGQISGGSKMGRRFVSIPLFTLGLREGPGQVRRQCTREFKIAPIETFIRRQILGLRPKQPAPREVVVDQWFGISADEQRRVRFSPEPWKQHVYPLCGLPEPMLQKPMSRRDCLAWLAKHFPQRVVPRSACIGCPFHSDVEWAAIKRRPEEWADAVAFDRAIRHCGGARGDFFLHVSRKPLADVDLRTDVERGQRLLWQDECMGACGV